MAEVYTDEEVQALVEKADRIVAMMDEAHSFGEFLRFMLKEEGMTMRDLAKTLMVHPSTVSRWCNDKIKPSFVEVTAMCYYLGGDPEDVYCLV